MHPFLAFVRCARTPSWCPRACSNNTAHELHGHAGPNYLCLVYYPAFIRPSDMISGRLSAQAHQATHEIPSRKNFLLATPISQRLPIMLFL